MTFVIFLPKNQSKIHPRAVIGQNLFRRKTMADLKFEILKHFGIISADEKEWKKELNLVSWNGRDPKLDVRDWAPGHERMGKGITLTKDEAAKLAELLMAHA